MKLPCSSIEIRAQSSAKRFQRGIAMVDLVVGLAILTIAIMPVGFAFARERQVLKVEYQRAVINELVDGEMEILLAGLAKNLAEGVQNYSVTTRTVQSLPPGHFQLTKTGNQLRLEWLPAGKHAGSIIAREGTLK